jgi:hypothetical protein
MIERSGLQLEKMVVSAVVEMESQGGMWPAMVEVVLGSKKGSKAVVCLQGCQS